MGLGPKPATSLTFYVLPTNKSVRSPFKLYYKSDHIWPQIPSSPSHNHLSLINLYPQDEIRISWGKIQRSAILKLFRRFQCAVGLGLLSSQETDDSWVGFIVFGESETGVFRGAIWPVQGCRAQKTPKSDITPGPLGALGALYPFLSSQLFTEQRPKMLREVGQHQVSFLQLSLCHTTDALCSLSGYYVK